MLVDWIAVTAWVCGDYTARISLLCGTLCRTTVQSCTMEPENTMKIREIAHIASAVTVISVLIEAPIVLVYVAVKWVAAFVGGLTGLLLWTVGKVCWRKAKAYRAKRRAATPAA